MSNFGILFICFIFFGSILCITIGRYYEIKEDQEWFENILKSRRKIMKKIHDIVNKCIQKYTGGEEYFDALDDMIKNDEDILKKLFKESGSYLSDYIVVSGEFGEKFIRVNIEEMKNLNIGYFIFNGGLRKGNVPDVIEYMNPDGKIKTASITLLDDSTYSHTTLNVMFTETKKIINVLHADAYVVYDGSKTNPSGFSLSSFYNYYSK